MWSYRTLDRNIGSQYYERLLLSQHKDTVEGEMKALTAPFDKDRMEFIKNPTVAEFIGLSPNSDFTETELEGAIIGNLQKFLLELLCKPLHKSSAVSSFESDFNNCEP